MITPVKERILRTGTYVVLCRGSRTPAHENLISIRDHAGLTVCETKRQSSGSCCHHQQDIGYCIIDHLDSRFCKPVNEHKQAGDLKSRKKHGHAQVGSLFKIGGRENLQKLPLPPSLTGCLIIVPEACRRGPRAPCNLPCYHSFYCRCPWRGPLLW